MKYREYLKNLFKGLTLQVEDLLLFEDFQIKYLPERLTEEEFSVLIQTYPFVKNFFVLKYPPIESYIQTVSEKNKEREGNDRADYICRELLWEIAELIVYNKHPEIYEKEVNLNWHIKEIIPASEPEGKIVIDSGAGTGLVSFLVAPFAKSVFAVEPVTAFRRYIQKKAKEKKIRNVYPVDGLLESIPFPDNFADILLTSNTIGWNLEAELNEIERIVNRPA